MAYRGEHYKGSIVHRFGGYDKPEICANCIRWSKRDGCKVKKRRNPADRCNVFEFAKYANYRLDGHGGVEYNDEYLAYLARKRDKGSEVKVSYIDEIEDEVDESGRVAEGAIAFEQGDSANSEPPLTDDFPDEISALKAISIEYIDMRPMGGALWVVGGREIEEVISDLEGFGLTFHYKDRGGKATGGRAAWWCKKHSSRMTIVRAPEAGDVSPFGRS